MLYNLIAGKNVIDFYSVDFDDTLNYSIRLENNSSCQPSSTVAINDVFYCDNKVRLTFELPCLDYSRYTLIIFDSNTEEEKYKFNAIYTT